MEYKSIPVFTLFTPKSISPTGLVTYSEAKENPRLKRRYTPSRKLIKCMSRGIHMRVSCLGREFRASSDEGENTGRFCTGCAGLACSVPACALARSSALFAMFFSISVAVLVRRRWLRGAMSSSIAHVVSFCRAYNIENSRMLGYKERQISYTVVNPRLLISSKPGI